MPPTELLLSATFALDAVEGPLGTLTAGMGAVRYAAYGEIGGAPGVCLMDALDLTRRHPECEPAAVCRETARRRIKALGKDTVVILCPRSIQGPSGFGDLVEGLLREERVPFWSASTVASLYPSVFSDTNYDSEEINRVIHNPYSPLAVTALAHLTARCLYTQWRTWTPKLVVLDADNTLWGGIVGETDDHGHVRLTEDFATVHSFMLKLKEHGMLLAISSKNNLEDVHRGLESVRLQSDRALTPADFIAIHSDWRHKSDHLQDLASLTGFSYSEMIFVDDNPVECAQVDDVLPAVHCVPLQPAQGQSLDSFLHRSWVFDLVGGSAIDKDRTALYHIEAQRQVLKSTYTSHSAFLASLHVQVQMDEGKEEPDLQRIVQLTKRTNQMNMSKREFTYQEVKRLSEDAASKVLIARVTDRFGHYGSVGALGYTITDSITVLFFLVSCRALYRDVEYKMFDVLRASARDLNLPITIPWKLSQRNKPGMRFIASLPFSSFQVFNAVTEQPPAKTIGFENIETFPENDLDRQVRRLTAGLYHGSSGHIRINVSDLDLPIQKPLPSRNPTQPPPAPSDLVHFAMLADGSTPITALHALVASRPVSLASASLHTAFVALWADLLGRGLTRESVGRFRRKMRHRIKLAAVGCECTE